MTDHAITINAEPAAVWPWLVQMGWHRAGWYTARWVDLLLFPANEAAADRIHPEWQALAVGDRVLDGDPSTECFFNVEHLEAQRSLVLHSTSHLPPQFRDRYHASIDWSWTFVLHDLGGRTRFHFRTRARIAPRWLRLAYQTVLVPADHVMAQQMLTGIATRAEDRHLGNVRAARHPVADAATALALMAISPAIRPVHLRWGATGGEVRSAMPGDQLLSGSQFTATRAITIDASPEAVWPWLLQVGVGRAGFYSYDLLDNHGQPSADHLLDPQPQPAVGDLAAPMTDTPGPTTSFRIAELDPPHTLVWAKPDSTWAWQLRPIDGGRTRLTTRLKVRYRLRPSAMLTIALIEFGDFAMMRRMLTNLRRNATTATRIGHASTPARRAD